MSDETKDVFEGYDEDFELLDTVDFGGEKYFVLIPASEGEEDDSEVYIMKQVIENGEEMLEAVEDDTEFGAVYDIFKENNADEFEFLD